MNPLERRIFSRVKICYSLHGCGIFSLSLLFSLKQKLCQDANTVYVSDLIRPNFLSIISFLTRISKLHVATRILPSSGYERKRGNPYLPAPHIQGGCSARCFNFSLPLGKFHTLAGLLRAGGVIYKIEFKAKKYIVNYC